MFRRINYYLARNITKQSVIVRSCSQNMSTYRRQPDNEKLIRTIFEKSVEAVQPKFLFQKSKCLQVLTNEGRTILQVTSGVSPTTNLQIDITEKRCHLVGFGKAVFGMAVEVEKILEQRLVSGIISVPIGTQDKFKNNPEMKLGSGSCIEVYEGAKNNLPDRPAEDCARHIRRKVKNLKEEDVLIVLISGGGSALLPLAKSPIKLNEKVKIIKQLAGKGATIEELNTVRIAISELKGGKLAALGAKASHIISLVISDIVGDPLHLIASGPTISFDPTIKKSALNIIQNYNLLKDIPTHVLDIIKNSINDVREHLKNSSVFVIGNNQIAVNAALAKAESNGFSAFLISNRIQGNVTDLSEVFVSLALSIKKFMLFKIDESEFEEKILKLQSYLEFDNQFISNLISTIKSKDCDICLISGGEPTVKIYGKGMGGRNQELALRFGHLASKHDTLQDVIFLSCGTDGIDGPTDAAGAISNPQQITESKQHDDIVKCLKNNDSYNFLKNFRNGKYHVITGHTGTNVMDIQVLIIPRKILSKL